jgi:hypothetical protein
LFAHRWEGARSHRNFKEIRINERFASGKVELFDAKLDRFVEIREKLIKGHQAERVIFRRARDEAMVAPEVAKGACDLEPESIQMVELQYRVIRGHGLRKSQNTSRASNWNPVLFLSKRRLQLLPAWRATKAKAGAFASRT